MASLTGRLLCLLWALVWFDPAITFAERMFSALASHGHGLLEAGESPGDFPFISIHAVSHDIAWLTQ